MEVGRRRGYRASCHFRGKRKSSGDWVQRGEMLVLIDAILLLLLVCGADTSYATIFMNKTIRHSFFLFTLLLVISPCDLIMSKMMSLSSILAIIIIPVL